MTPMLDGPRLAPASGGPARQLVIFAHGYGADGNDLIALGREWQGLLPEAAFVSPHAPEPCAQAPMGRQWFALTSLDLGECEEGVRRAAPALDAFIDAELDRHGLDESRLALVGFSQGTMICLHAGLRRTRPVAGIVGFSGALAAAQSLEAEIASRPPVLLVHGDQDSVIPVAALDMAAQVLGKAGVPVRWHVSRGIDHGIAPDGLELAGRFLVDCLTTD